MKPVSEPTPLTKEQYEREIQMHTIKGIHNAMLRLSDDLALKMLQRFLFRQREQILSEVRGEIEKTIDDILEFSPKSWHSYPIVAMSGKKGGGFVIKEVVKNTILNLPSLQPKKEQDV